MCATAETAGWDPEVRSTSLPWVVLGQQLCEVKGQGVPSAHVCFVTGVSSETWGVLKGQSLCKYRSSGGLLC